MQEVQWEDTASTIPEALQFDQFAEARNSGYFNVIVSEEHQDESKSLKSQGSNKSLAISDHASQGTSVEVPTYVIKGSPF